MEEVITKEEQLGEEIMTLFPRLEELRLDNLAKLRHFFLTKRVTEFPFLREVTIRECPYMKTFVQQGIPVSLESTVNNDDEVKTMFNSKVCVIHSWSAAALVISRDTAIVIGY